MTVKHEALFQPIKIGNIEIKNRIVFLPTCTRFGGPDGTIDEQAMAYTNARAKGGAGLLIPWPVGLHGLAEGPKMFRLVTQQNFIGMSLAVEQVHIFGAKIFAQCAPPLGQPMMLTRNVLTELDWGQLESRGGGTSPSRVPFVDQTREIWGPKQLATYDKRGIPLPNMYAPRELPLELTIEQIQESEDVIGVGVKRLKACGFDGIEIHACHGGMVWSFLSPRRNLRTDVYGGSLYNRMRYLRNCLAKAKEEAGSDFAVGVRISLEDPLPGGHDIEETMLVAQELEKLGADYISLDNGTYETSNVMMPDEDATMLPGTARVKSVVKKIPVIVASIHDPVTAENAIIDGKADMIGLCRQLLCDPEWPNKVAKGEKFVKCDRCNLGCWQRLREGLPIRCRLNPAVGFERYMPEYYPKPPFREEWKAYGTYDIH